MVLTMSGGRHNNDFNKERFIYCLGIGTSMAAICASDSTHHLGADDIQMIVTKKVMLKTAANCNRRGGSNHGMTLSIRSGLRSS